MPFASAGLYALLLVATLCSFCDAQNVDGGRSELPGMRKDMFDDVQRQKKMGGPKMGGKIPDCPRSDKMSPFFGLAFSATDMYVKIDSTEGKCQRLITVNGANYTELLNMSRTCGPPGEYKKRIAEELSAMFFQGGFEWVKSENETVEVVTDEGTFQLEVNEANYAILEECWKKGCGCEQVKSPMMQAILFAVLAIAVGGLTMDSGKALLNYFRGVKPPKHVECKKGHRINEVKFAHNHHCDICSARGTNYQCNVNCNYDLCKKCYKETKKKVKVKWAEWLETHPEDRKAGKEKEDDDEDDKKKAESGDEKSGDDKAGEKSETESGTEAPVTSEGGSRDDDDEDKGKSETSGDKEE